ncbi:MAG TPA: metallophosphoesterase [Thermoanaerobaculaceae bacterium]|nr:metallophosphoesterase [Thermoanaerobaculaceae bacterium]HPS78705.1 metallophosphoesterase [Thermoanaerobaculaceae bacterium]
MADRGFRVVQLSDLHLTADDRDARSEATLFGRQTGMNAAFRRILADPAVRGADLILTTGDVTDRGDLAAWRLFWSGLEAAGLRGRCRVIPGNHDVCCLGIRPVARRGRRVADDLARLEAGLALGGDAPARPWAEVLAGGRLVLFGLDSSHPGNVSALTNAVGELGMPQLERLARLLRQHHDVPVKLVALHHSPNIPRAATQQRRGLPVLKGPARWGQEVPAADRRALRLLCVSHGVRLIVHGHLHRFEDRRVNGVRIVGAPASTEPVAVDGRRGLPILLYTLTSRQQIRIEPRLVS